jgi:8-amino-7-oxononanoate synthase
MAGIFNSIGSSNPIARRCEKDKLTKERLRYNPYYLSFERQEGSRVWLDGREMVMLSSNEYLGLSDHPKVIEAGKKALDEWGSSTTGARSSNGTRAYHVRLEQKIADFIGKEAVHISVAGYISCMSAVASFAERGDVVFADRNIHSSLVTGMRLTGARMERFSHNNAAELEEILKLEKPDIGKLVVFDGVYSMEGHTAPVDLFVSLAKSYGCFTVLDDAHGFGVLGEGGRGTASHFQCTDDVDIICGSFSKALASTGGFVAGSRAMIDYLRTHSSQTIFSAAISPSQAACAEAAFEIMVSEPEYIAKLWENTARLKGIYEDLGLDTWQSSSPALPVVIGDRNRAFFFWKTLMENGVFGVLSTAPGVPPGKDMIRTAASARHSDADFEIIEKAFKVAVKKHL